MAYSFIYFVCRNQKLQLFEKESAIKHALRGWWGAEVNCLSTFGGKYREVRSEFGVFFNFFREVNFVRSEFRCVESTSFEVNSGRNESMRITELHMWYAKVATFRPPP